MAVTAGTRWPGGSRSELKDKLIASEGFTERHYQPMYERYLLNLFRAFEENPEDRHLRTVIRLLNQPELAMYLRELDDEQAAEEIAAYLQGLTGEQVKDLRGLADRCQQAGAQAALRAVRDRAARPR